MASDTPLNGNRDQAMEDLFQSDSTPHGRVEKDGVEDSLRSGRNEEELFRQQIQQGSGENSEIEGHSRGDISGGEWRDENDNSVPAMASGAEEYDSGVNSISQLSGPMDDAVSNTQNDTYRVQSIDLLGGDRGELAGTNIVDRAEAGNEPRYTKASLNENNLSTDPAVEEASVGLTSDTVARELAEAAAAKEAAEQAEAEKEAAAAKEAAEQEAAEKAAAEQAEAEKEAAAVKEAAEQEAAEKAAAEQAEAEKEAAAAKEAAEQEAAEQQEGLNLVGTNNSDELVGGAGDDTFLGHAGDDNLVGGAGDDVFRVDGDDGVDQISGGEGHDTLQGGRYNDVIRVEDNLSNLDSVEAIDGGDGWNQVVGTAEADTLDFSAEGAPTLVDIDRITGGRGDDTIINDDTGREIYGEAGNDTLVGGAGDEQAYGGQGDDTFIFSSGGGSDYFDGGSGWTDAIQIAPDTDADNPWTIVVGGEEVEFDMASQVLELSPDTSGTIQMADGSEIDFDGVEKILW